MKTIESSLHLALCIVNVTEAVTKGIKSAVIPNLLHTLLVAYPHLLHMELVHQPRFRLAYSRVAYEITFSTQQNEYAFTN